VAEAVPVDADQIERDLRSLIRIPSITGSEAAVQNEIERLFIDAGLQSERLEPDPAALARDDPDWPGSEMARVDLPIVVGRLGRGGGRRILLVGHVDVVPPGDPETWTVDPWGAEVREGRMYGRGACDMKGGVAAVIGAVRATARFLSPACPPRRTAGRGCSPRSGPA